MKQWIADRWFQICQLSIQAVLSNCRNVKKTYATSQNWHLFSLWQVSSECFVGKRLFTGPAKFLQGTWHVFPRIPPDKLCVSKIRSRLRRSRRWVVRWRWRMMTMTMRSRTTRHFSITYECVERAFQDGRDRPTTTTGRSSDDGLRYKRRAVRP